MSVEPEPEVRMDTPQLQPPEPLPGRKKARKVYAAEDFKIEQPLHGGCFPKLVKRSHEWFDKYHTKLKIERNNPFPMDRNATKAQVAAFFEPGQELHPRRKSRE